MSFRSISISYIVYCQLDQGANFVLQKAQYSPVYTAQTNPGRTRVKTNPGCVYTTLFQTNPGLTDKLTGVEPEFAVFTRQKLTRVSFNPGRTQVSLCRVNRAYVAAGKLSVRTSSTVYFPIVKSHHPVLQEKTRSIK